jgi:beta-glucosidase-like glycosyl hydrolase/CubicO group peptidase (beta-lactamase class C family)
MRRPMIFILYLLALLQINAQQIPPLYAGEGQTKWVDSVYNKMTLEEKIGQLFMPFISSEVSTKNKKHILHLINELKVGNFFFLKGHPSDEKYLNTFIQANSTVPAITAIDAEWGLAMRLDSTAKFPWNMTLGAIRNGDVVYKIGKEIAKDCKSMGFSMNFSPVLDINTNPDNPIIGNRSFGEDKNNVAVKGLQMMKALQDENLLTTAKHFPGHGDTSQDSHKTLPSVNFSYDRIWDVELYPYRKLIPQGLTGVMVAHLKVPALDYLDLPTTLSSQVVTGLLKNKMEFDGLVITDAMNMKGVADFVESGTADLYAFLAGNDILLGTIEIEKAIKDFKKAYQNKILTEERLAHSVKKILRAKYWARLPQWKPSFKEDYKPSHRDSVLNMQAYEQAITLIKNDKKILPIKDLTQKIAFVPMGDGNYKTFYDYLNKYTRVDMVKINRPADIPNKLKKYDLIIVGWHKDTSTPWKTFKFSEKEIALLKKISSYKPTVLDVFTTPYALVNVIDKITPKAIIISYENNFFTQMLSPQMIFGAIPFKGMLPVSINSDYRVHTAIYTKELKRLSYGFPEQVGIDSRKLKRVDSLMQFMIDTMAAPGGVVLAARNGKVFFEKAYGYQTYEKKRKVLPSDLYDLASVTKVLAATTLMMKAYDEKMYKLDDKLGDLMPLLRGTNKDTVTVREALSHYGRIRAWIPFYQMTIDQKTKKPSWRYYRTRPNKVFNVKITEHLYLKSNYVNKIWDTIATTPQYEKLRYKYSGLPFYLFKKYIQDKKGISMDKLLDSLFYKPLGAETVTYNPLNKFPASRIAPTEIDDYWRNQELRGTVHDMGAAMLNGVSGNAGLFGNANDIAKIMQMHLNKGYYGGQRYISDSTEEVFNHRYFVQDSVRRGLGWDKPQFKGKPGPTFEEISPKSFGHQGFTGTMVWADPEENIVYVFLSNRTYPKMDNTLLYELNIRSEVQRRIYEAIINPKHNYHHQSVLNPYEKWKPEKDSLKVSE